MTVVYQFMSTKGGMDTMTKIEETLLDLIDSVHEHVCGADAREL